jgi:hypothetical protein
MFKELSGSRSTREPAQQTAVLLHLEFKGGEGEAPYCPMPAAGTRHREGKLAPTGRASVG